jgi:subtilase family serine protease
MAAGQQATAVPARITQPVDIENLVTLRGNTHPLARPEFDQGAAPDSLPTERILLVLQRSPAQETALRKLLDEQQIKASPNYHMWLTPEQFGQQFGPADADIQTITDWLTSQGFQVSHVAAGRTVIEFSGTAGQVRQAFHAEIHRYEVNGEEHWANASDPQIPAALAPVVAGFASLNNFPKRPSLHRLGTFSKSKATGVVAPLFTFPSENFLGVGPGDFATIYNLAPLWSAGIDGSGQTIAIVTGSNINVQDARDFRAMFGLPANDPQIILNGPDPGVSGPYGEETEADIDVEWAGAVAKGATIDLVVSESTEVTEGVDLSALYIVDNNFAPIMSESYGACEAELGSSGNTFQSTLWEQGAAQGITILVASGDSGSAGCDSSSFGEIAAQQGLAVSGLASTPFDVAVGGTDFNDSSSLSTYWSTTNNSITQSSALSYIPEITWDDSCANTGSLTGCGTSWNPISSINLGAGGGGPSNCATSTSTPCTAGYAKPSWQTGTGVPADGVRDIPDISLFAGDGYNGSFYIYCETDTNLLYYGGSSSCNLSSFSLTFQGAGGTSFAVQAFGGIMALVNQKNGRQGNANYVLYPLAAKTGASCGSNAAMAPTASSSSCIFYDVQVGDNSVACVGGSPNCSNQSASGYGILVNPSNTAQPAWLTTAGYDLATGLGTVNAANLVNNWTSVSFSPTTTTLSLSPTSITHGQPVTVNIGVTSGSGTPAGDVSLVGGPNNSNLGIGYLTLGADGTVSEPTVLLPGGSYNVTAQYAGDGIHGASDSPPVPVMVNPENSETAVQLVTFNSNGIAAYNQPSAVYGSLYLLRMDVTNGSGKLCISAAGVPVYQCPTGQVTVTNNGGPITDQNAPADNSPGAYTLNSQGNAEDTFIQLPGGAHSLVATYAGNSSYNGSTSATDMITVTQALPTAVIATANPTTVQSGAPVTLTALVLTNSSGLAPSGAVQFLNAGVPVTGAVNYTATNGSSIGPAFLTATLTTSFTANATITAQYAGDANYQGLTTATALQIQLSTSPPDFSLKASPSNSITITAPGQSGSTFISATPIAGFTGTITLTCALPSTMTYGICSLSTTYIFPGGSTIVTVSTTSPSTTFRPLNRPSWFIPSAGTLFACIFLLLIPRKKRRAKLAFGCLVFALLAAALVACGGKTSSPLPSSPGTPPGSYAATVTATSGTLTHSLTIPVTVQ